jgi:hypothetical protein
MLFSSPRWPPRHLSQFPDIGAGPGASPFTSQTRRRSGELQAPWHPNPTWYLAAIKVGKRKVRAESNKCSVWLTVFLIATSSGGWYYQGILNTNLRHQH